MDVDFVSSNWASTAADPTITAEWAAQNREIVQAIRAVNQSEMFGGENMLDFQMDPGTRKMAVRVIDRKTREVIGRHPPEYALRMASALKP